MNTSTCQHTARAFTRTELAVTIIAVLFLAAGFMQVRAVRMRDVQARQTCIYNLKQVGLGHRVWSKDSDDKVPQQFLLRDGGTREYLLTGLVFRHYQAMSNELGSPAVLACPADSRRAPASFAGSWSNANISYFVSMDAEEVRPHLILSGERNITNGVAPAAGLLTITPADFPGWDRPWHQGHGILGLADGSVHQMTTAQLQSHITTNPQTNRLALP